MLAATHMLAGASVYKLTNENKLIGLPLAFASHFVLDRIHHYDLTITGNLVVGVPIIVFMLYLGWRRKDLFLLVAAFLGMLPDLLSILHISDRFHEFHMFLHFEPYYPLPLYLLIFEGLFILFFLLYLLKRKASVQINRRKGEL